MFRSILVISRELLNIKKAYIRTQMVKYTKVQTFIAQILMYLITYVFTDALLMFSNSLKMREIDRNMS
jgi:hypothetical protein